MSLKIRSNYLSDKITKREDYLDELSAGGGGIAGIVLKILQSLTSRTTRKIKS